MIGCILCFMKHDKDITSLHDYIKWVQGFARADSRFIYRGLSNMNYNCVSSAFRRIEPDAIIQKNKNLHKVFTKAHLQYTESLLVDYEAKDLQKEAHIDNINKMQILADIQHKGGATPLIDFTFDALVALLFAIQNNIDYNAVVLAIDTKQSNAIAQFKISDNQLKISQYLQGDILYYWDTTHHNQRILAQKSVFVFGKPIINFEMDSNFEYCIIVKEKKSAIINELRQLGHEYTNLFPDYLGFIQNNAPLS